MHLYRRLRRAAPSVDDLSTPADIIKTSRKHNNYTIKARPSDYSLVRDVEKWGAERKRGVEKRETERVTEKNREKSEREDEKRRSQGSGGGWWSTERKGVK